MGWIQELFFTFREWVANWPLLPGSARHSDSSIVSYVMIERWCWHLRQTQSYFDIILILDEIHPDIWRGWACRFVHHRRVDYWHWWMSALCECPSSCLRICGIGCVVFSLCISASLSVLLSCIYSLSCCHTCSLSRLLSTTCPVMPPLGQF